MFVQISPNASDVGETLCSLNFASRVRGIESGPARKQTDLTELFKYKQMVIINLVTRILLKVSICVSKLLQFKIFTLQAEKFKHDEKESKKLQDNLQSLQLRLAAREQICRNLQEKVTENLFVYFGE